MVRRLLASQARVKPESLRDDTRLVEGLVDAPPANDLDRWILLRLDEVLSVMDSTADLTAAAAELTL